MLKSPSYLFFFFFLIENVTVIYSFGCRHFFILHKEQPFKFKSFITYDCVHGFYSLRRNSHFDFFFLILVLSVGKCQENEKLVPTIYKALLDDILPSSQFWLGHSLYGKRCSQVILRYRT